jgi:hypothetical protein
MWKQENPSCRGNWGFVYKVFCPRKEDRLQQHHLQTRQQQERQ